MAGKMWKCILFFIDFKAAFDKVNIRNALTKFLCELIRLYEGMNAAV